MTGRASATSVRASYDDDLLNALTTSHVVDIAAELWFAGAKVADLLVVDGGVTADAGARVRRTCELTVDPTGMVVDGDLRPYGTAIQPYGSYVKVWRGVRFPDTAVILAKVFEGRIDRTATAATGAVRLTCSDRGVDIQDARFEAPWVATAGQLVLNAMQALIFDVNPAAVVDIEGADTHTVGVLTFDRDRGEALDELAASIGFEWSATVDGGYLLRPVPELTNIRAEPKEAWTLDSGAAGVVIEDTSDYTRDRVFNAVVAIGEPQDAPPVRAVVRNDATHSPLRWGGPFGKVPRFFASPLLRTTDQAAKAAATILSKATGLTRTRRITCVANPRLAVGDVVAIQVGDDAELHIVDGFTLPLAPETSMTVDTRSSGPPPENTPPSEGSDAATG